MNEHNEPNEHNELTPSEQHLADQLRRQARSLDLGDTAVATVVRRGRQRRERHRAIVGVAAVVALSGTVIGTVQLLSKPVTHKIVASNDSVPTEANDSTPPNATVPGTTPAERLTPVTRVDSNLVWNVVEPDSTEALGASSPVLGSVGYQATPPYLAWSTAPGRPSAVSDPAQNYLPQLWRSDDGIHWQLANSDPFTQPEIQVYGLGARNGRLFAFGTAAATAPIAKGAGGDLVVDVSDDQGASWRHIVLPVDLRGLAKMDGVQSVGLTAAFAVGDKAVVAVATAFPNLSATVLQRFAGGFTISRQGLTPLSFPNCGGGYTATTISGSALPIIDGTTPADTSPVMPASTTTDVNSEVATATVAADSTGCTVDTTPQQGALVPWGDLNVDPQAVAAMFTPRVFVSTDGETFQEGVFPPPPDGYQPGTTPQLFATDHGFIGMAQFWDALGQKFVTTLYASADGLTWTASDSQLGQINTLQALGDGTLIAFGQDNSPYPNSGAWVATSSDGSEWTKRSMSGLLEPGDGTSALLNVWQSSAGPDGITALANVDVDMAAEAGGFSIDKDGVRLTMTESRYGTMVATDIASGEELGRADGRAPVGPDSILGYAANGGMRLLNPDGTVRTTFSDQEMQGIYSEMSNYRTKLLILHSADGINWSRDDVKPLTGFDSNGGGRIQVTGSNVLVSIVEAIPFNADGTSTQPGTLPKTVVLVGTPKS